VTPGFIDLFIQGGDDEPRPEEFARPTWLGPPEDELGVLVPVAAIVARSEGAVVALRGVVAYSTGAMLDLVAAARGLAERDAGFMFHEQHQPDPNALSDHFLRVGIELSDDSRASNLVDRRLMMWAPDATPEAPVLVQVAGGTGSAGGGRVTMNPGYWLWPLPPRGPFRLVVEWPAVSIELTTTELDATPIVDAASRAQRLWPA
jgi:hypothetical protein